MFYDKLLNLCVEKEMSPTAAAKAIGMTGAHVSKWKSGSKPNDTTLIKFSNFFDVPMSYFLETSIKKEPAPINENEFTKLYVNLSQEHQAELDRYARYLQSLEAEPKA